MERKENVHGEDRGEGDRRIGDQNMDVRRDREQVERRDRTRKSDHTSVRTQGSEALGRTESAEIRKVITCQFHSPH